MPKRAAIARRAAKANLGSPMSGRMYARSGRMPARMKPQKVAVPLRAASRSVGRLSAFDRSERTSLTAIDVPSAKRLAKPRIRIVCVDSAAPTMPATMANVVTIPSVAPYTISGKYVRTTPSCRGSPLPSRRRAPPVHRGMSDAFQRDGRAFAAADADGGYAAPETAALEGVEQGDHDPRAGGAYRVAESAGAAVHVHPLAREGHLLHERHRHDGESFVDLPEIDIVDGPAQPVEELLRGGNRGGREPARRLGVRGVAEDPGARRDAVRLASRGRGEHQRRGAVGDRGGVRRCHRAVLAEGGLSCGIFSGRAFFG